MKPNYYLKDIPNKNYIPNDIYTKYQGKIANLINKQLIPQDPALYLDLFEWFLEAVEDYGDRWTVKRFEDVSISEDRLTLYLSDFDDDGEDIIKEFNFSSYSEAARKLANSFGAETEWTIAGFCIYYGDCPVEEINELVDSAYEEAKMYHKRSVEGLSRELGKKLLPPIGYNPF